MPRCWSPVVVAGIGWLVCVADAAGQTPVPTPAQVGGAIRYVEHRMNSRSRVIPTAETEASGIDINSSVSIEVDEAALTRALSAGSAADSEAVVLLERTVALERAVKAIPPLRATLQAAFAEWDAAAASGNNDSLFALIRRMANLEDSVVTPLDSAIRARLRAAGKSPDEARRETQAIRQSLRAFGTGGYDWDRLGQQLGLEIAMLDAELKARQPRGALEIEIQAHRLGKNGAVAIALPGYNEETVGPAAVFDKVQFSVPAAEQQLYERNAGLAASVGATVSFAQALRQSVETEFAGERAAIEAAITSAREFLATTQGELGRVTELSQAGQMETWIGSVRQTLEVSPEGQKVLTLGEQLAQSLPDVRQDVTVLAGYASLAAGLPSMPPQAAVAAIARTVGANDVLARHRALNPQTWRRRAALIADFVAAVGAARAPALHAALTAPGTPVAALRAAGTAIGAAAGRLPEAASAALTWLDKLTSGQPALAVADLPVPEAQQRVALAGRSADTEFDLQTIRSGREPGDRVLVTVRFYRDGVPLPVEAHERLRIQSYGWNARFIASLAWLTRQGSSFAFRATPAMSWMARYRRWPSDGATGLGGAPAGGIGFGLTAMSLDFLDTEQVELGLAGTLGFLDDRLLVGAGLDLQATDNRFFGFFSIRLFSVSGGIGP